MEILGFVLTILALVIVLKLLTLPFKIIIKFVINSIIGAIAVFILSLFGIVVIINWITILLVGILGVPGVVISIIISMFM